MEGLPSSMKPILGKLSEMVMLLLPNGQSSQFTFQSLQWETVVYLPVISLLVGLLFTFRLVQSVKSRLFVRHEKQLAETLAAQIDEKCQLTDKYHAAKNEYAEMETSLENARLESESINVLGLTETYRKLRRVNMMMRQELNSLVQELMKERFMQSKQEEEMEEMLKVLKSLEEVMRITRSQGLLETSQQAKHQALIVSSLGVGLSTNCAVPHPPLRPPNMPGCIHPPPSHSTGAILRPEDA
uniref:Uncharacterized protein n=1 Tax=Rangifer tarandus platyrhynchus TaxID=3082113 RepID=A0ACB0DZT9_RANTA|nr:unnamed protein product [Rangifer tarandus platyrhynchus]